MVQSDKFAHRKSAEVVNGALAHLAERLRIASDLVDVDRDAQELRKALPASSATTGGQGRKKMYQSLRWGAFLLAFAGLEGFFDELVDYRAEHLRTIKINVDSLVREIEASWPGTSLRTAHWVTYTRGPATKPNMNKSEWHKLVGKKKINDYLTDMKDIRNILAHGGDGYLTTKPKSETLWPTKKHGYSLRMMGVEGFIRFSEDLATWVGIDVAGDAIVRPSWPMPTPTGVSRENVPPRP